MRYTLECTLRVVVVLSVEGIKNEAEAKAEDIKKEALREEKEVAHKNNLNTYLLNIFRGNGCPRGVNSHSYRYYFNRNGCLILRCVGFFFFFFFIG